MAKLKKIQHHQGDLSAHAWAPGRALYGYYFDGFWQDLGTQERIAEAERQLRGGQARLHYL